MRYNFDRQLKMVFTVAEGVVSLKEILEHLDGEASEGLLAYREIIDASAASTDLTSEEVRQLVSRLQTMARGGLFGATCVVATDDVFFGMAMMLGILCELSDGPKIGVFRSLDKGLEWLVLASPV